MARILLVEDDPDVAELEYVLLSARGHRVVHASDGLDAVSLAQREAWDVAIVDLDLPALSGEVVLRVLGDLRGAASIVVSGTKEPWQNAMLEAGAAATLRKPFAPRALVGLVDDVMSATTRRGRWPGDVRRLEAEDLKVLERMSPHELDRLPFGVMRIDRSGRIAAFNAFEAQAAELSPGQVIGKSLEDIAPCLLVRDFLGAARDDTQQRMDRVMRFVFPHHRGLCVVNVRLFREDPDEWRWLAISKRVFD